jgi:hypothetical protein
LNARIKGTCRGVFDGLSQNRTESAVIVIRIDYGGLQRISESPLGMLNDISTLLRCPSFNKCYVPRIEIVFSVGDYLNLNHVPHKIRIKINQLAAFVRRRPGSDAETENAFVPK